MTGPNIKSADALANAALNRANRKFPGLDDPRRSKGLIFPAIHPKFHISRTDAPPIFTIGSCFARNIEKFLSQQGFPLPMLKFVAPREEWPNAPNGLLNEYNPGSMSQRILYALQSREFPTETIVPSGNLQADLLLHAGSDVTAERAISRRREIFDVYAELATSKYAIITLGLVEAWYDNDTKLYLNRMPPAAVLHDSPERFSLRVLDVEDSLPLLFEAMEALGAAGVNVILTVSPVPLLATFTNSDCAVANEFSKAVLRVCAEKLVLLFPHVDYFPSYEIVRSGGLSCYVEDGAHVRDDVVGSTTNLMMEKFATS